MFPILTRVGGTERATAIRRCQIGRYDSLLSEAEGKRASVSSVPIGLQGPLVLRVEYIGCGEGGGDNA